MLIWTFFFLFVKLLPKICPHISATFRIYDSVIDVPGKGKTIEMWVEGENIGI
jgi:hypothetical protein